VAALITTNGVARGAGVAVRTLGVRVGSPCVAVAVAVGVLVANNTRLVSPPGTNALSPGAAIAGDAPAVTPGGNVPRITGTPGEVANAPGNGVKVGRGVRVGVAPAPLWLPDSPPAEHATLMAATNSTRASSRTRSRERMRGLDDTSFMGDS